MSLLDQIRDENPSLAYVSDDELIEQLLDDYQGDLSPEQFIKSLTEERQVSPVASPTDLTSPDIRTGGKRAFAPAESPSDIGFGQALTGPLKSSWARSWGPAITRLRGGIAGLMGDEERAAQLYNQAEIQDANIIRQTGKLIDKGVSKVKSFFEKPKETKVEPLVKDYHLNKFLMEQNQLMKSKEDYYPPLP